MNAVMDAIGECVERFVQEILALIEQVREERRAAMASSTASRVGAPPRPRRAAARAGIGAPSGGRRAAALESISGPPTVPSAPAPVTGTEVQASEREAVVLTAVRALARATAAEVARHSGLPNGSTSVALRALVARGQVARTEGTRGIEYSLVSPGDVKPVKRVKASTPSARSSEVEAPRAAAGGALPPASRRPSPAARGWSSSSAIRLRPHGSGRAAFPHPAPPED
jgi:hypothetical protein